PMDTQGRTTEENADKSTSAEDHGLSLEHLHALSSEDALNELIKFPGIGLNSASIIVLFCLRRPAFPVDVHAFRLSRWLNWVPDGANRITSCIHLEARVPNELKRPLVEMLIKHGMSCPRCRTSSRKPSESQERNCPIEHLVERTGKNTGAAAMNE